MSGLTKRKIGGAIREYMESDRIRKRDEKTRYNYTRCLTILKGVTGHQLNTVELRAKHINITLAKLSRCSCGTTAGGTRCPLCETQGRSELSLNNDRSILKAFVTWLHTHNLLSHNQHPCADIEMHRVKGFEKPIDDMILTPDQAARCLIEAGNRHPSYRAGFGLGLFAAMRESEVLDLKWGHIRVDAERRVIRFYRQKSDSWHTIPLVEALRHELDMYRAWLVGQFGEIDDEWYVVSRVQRNPGGTRVGETMSPDRPVMPHLRRGRLDDTYHTIFRAVGCDREGFGTHTLRRTGACFLLAHCKDKDLVRQYLGHSSVKTTETYTQYLDRLPELMDAVKGYDPVGSLAAVEALPRIPVPRTGESSNVVAFRPRQAG